MDITRWSVVEKLVCFLLGTIHISLGVATAIGGPDRFPPPGYGPLLDLTNGYTWPYGVLWAAGGTIMILAHGLWRLIGIGTVILISNLWAAMFMIAAFESPTAPFTPIAAYGGYGLVNGVLFALMVMHARREDGAD